LVASSTLAKSDTQISRLDHEIEALMRSSSEFNRNKQLKTLLFLCAHSAKDQVIASDLQLDSQATAL
jgi:hypothetical protein